MHTPFCCPEFRSNPAWTNHALFLHWKEIAKIVGLEAMPKIHHRTAKKLTAEEYGTGHFGTVLPTGIPGLVCKITSDSSEAQIVTTALARFGSDWPDGLIKYHTIFTLRGSHRRRPIYILWRDEAYQVGKWLPTYGSGSGAIDLHRLAFRLRTFFDWSHFVGKVAWNARAKNLVRSQIVRLSERVYPWSDLDPNAIEVPPLKGVHKAAYSLSMCFAIARRMEHEDKGYQVGHTFSRFLTLGIVLADVHQNNIGYKAGSKQLVITDPGHAVFLNNRFDKVFPKPIEEATMKDWK